MSARFAVTKIAGDKELTDEEVFETLKRQMRMTDCTLEISVRATEEQIDKAMRVLMMRVSKYEIRRMTRESA